jgi:ankyrin repeat protein
LSGDVGWRKKLHPEEAPVWLRKTPKPEGQAMWSEKLSIVKKNIRPYNEFILEDGGFSRQRTALINLYHISKSYKASGLSKEASPEPSSKISSFGILRRSNVIGYKLHLLHLALLDDRECNLNMELRPCCYNRTNLIFLLAMIKNRPDIVQFMLSSGFPRSINSSMFGSPIFPTYFHLACAMHRDVLAVFMGHSPDYTLSWNGLTPQMIASFKSNSLQNKQQFDFLTMQQYRQLNALRRIKMAHSREKPMFLVDFLCMNGDLAGAKRILDRNPELARASRMCYLVQNEIEWIMLLTRFQTCVYQEFNGLTPLHVSALGNNFRALVAFLKLGISPNSVDGLGNTPMHYCAYHRHLECLELLARCGGDLRIPNGRGESVQGILDHDGIELDVPASGNGLSDALRRMFGGSSILSQHLSLIDEIEHNLGHPILKKSRFTITSLLNLPHKIDYTESLAKQLGSQEQIQLSELMPSDSLRILTEYME